MIYLNKEDYFCSGGNRDVYYYKNKTRLIKITRQDVLQRRKKRSNFFKRFRKLEAFDENYEDEKFYKKINSKWLNFIPNAYGIVKTNLGDGFLTENILNDDGTQAISLEKFIATKLIANKNEETIYKLKSAIYDLVYNVLETNFISREMKEFNLVVKELKNGQLKIYIVDGFGVQEFIPIVKYIPFFGRNKIFKQFNRFKNNLIKKYYGGYMKNILITGANSGLGKELSIHYANSNTNLYLIARNMEELEKTKLLCEEKGANVFINSIDIRDREATKMYFNNLFENNEFNFDIVFANAGVSGGTADGYEEDEKIYEIFDTNVQGVINTINPVIQRMINKRSGRIVIISSIASFRGLPTAPAYSASKACIRYYGEALNNYLKEYNIDVNVVCPGFIKTPLTDKNDFPMPFIMEPVDAVKNIVDGIEKNKKFIIFPKILYYAILFLNMLPFGCGDYIFSKLPKKH